MGLQEVLGEEEEPGPQQDGDEAGARMRKLIPGSSSSTLEFGRIRSNEPYDQSTLNGRLDCCWPNHLRTEPRQPEANAAAEGYRFVMLAMPLQFLELCGFPVSIKHAKCEHLNAHTSAALASGYAAHERPSLDLEHNNSRVRVWSSIASVMLSTCLNMSSRISQ